MSLSRTASRDRSNSAEAHPALGHASGYRDGRAMYRSRSSSASGSDHRHYHHSESGGNGGGSGSHRNYPGPHDGNEQGVEVVLDSGTSKVVESDTPGRQSSQQVFRGAPPPPPPGPPPPHSAVRPRAMRAPHNGHTSMPKSGSFGGYGPGHSSQSHGSHRGGHPSSHYPNQVGYNPSGSFDQEGYHHSSNQHQTHYSPQVQYPPHGRYPNDQVNVISPSHREESQSHDNSRPPMTPRGRHDTGQYRYPPTSPVSRPSTSSRSGKPPQPEIRHSRSDGPYSQAQRGSGGNSSNVRHPDDGTFNAYTPSQGDDGRPPVVTESSFDSSYNHSPYSSHPPTPAVSHHYSPHPPTPSSHVSPHGSHYSNSGSHATHYSPHPQTPASGPGDAHQQFYGGGSWHSFDSSGAPNPPPPHFDDHRYYGYQANPESPYSSQHSHPHHDYQSPNGQHGGGYYNSPYPSDGRYSDQHHHHHSPHHPHDDVHPLLKDYDSSSAKPVTPGDKSSDKGARSTSSGIVLPKAASEIDFEVTQPPMTPVTPPGTVSVCESLSAVNGNDVLCGRGGGTNSQVGNRRFRKLVQEFQPTYLLARRKEKPLLARTIVLIIRKRGGRFLKKDDETGKLFEVGDAKAEAKTSQALREGLDVRATKNAASTLSDKKKKTKKKGTEGESSLSPNSENKASTDSEGGSRPSTPQSVKMTTSKDEDDEDQQVKHKSKSTQKAPPSPPPSMPPLDKMHVTGIVHPHSPEGLAFRKRRRMRSKEGAVQPGCCNDKLFMEFCPPRADLQRTASPNPGESESMDLNTPPHRNYASSSRDFKDSDVPDPQPGCVNIAMSAITGAATGSFCLGPTRWRS
mmetsp:Transcript_25562/g.35978  ORF Transcript_25562/g.35978 Transcript_25562/m.35978 type:complete len:846 (-) Transcript_25562:212-2749(-)